ncbi:OmpA family protein [Flavobacteriaceae bacterium]|nr:OmpA family protein [Flavobacteriaceae bacterium]MDB4108329.1 OmpA family protein [Flavobacteriaceae bacterium]MDB4206570.1 OmpA family protein [Flavobacteriaceae bacterium]
MRKIIFLFVLLVNTLQAQTTNTHVVYFETGRFNVTEIEVNRLVLFIQSLKDIEVERISIYGFCDDRGTDSYNLKLSQNRADAIKKIFSGLDMDENLITNVDGKGEVLLRVISSDNLNIIRGLNRKVEVRIDFKKPIITPEIETDEVEKQTEDNQLIKENIAVGDKIILDNILFKTGYSYIEEESVPVLEMLAIALRGRPELNFTIEGHICCTRNSRDSIDKRTGKRNLSLARARFIYDYLVDKGIKRNRMRYVGLKNKYPLGKDPKFDRRVEIKITYIYNKN